MDTDQLLERYELYSRILKKYFPEPGIDKFLDEFGTRMVTSPRGLTESDGGVYGGLVDFLSKVAIQAKKITTDNPDICSQESAVRVCLVHELGKLGTQKDELFISQESQWHREKLGQNFKYNEDCPKMGAAHRTLYLMQKYNITLTQEEWVAILLSQGSHYPENGFYANVDTPLASVVHFARSLALIS